MKLPITNSPSEKFSIDIFETVYQFKQMWNTKGYWSLNIADVDGKSIADGVKVVTGTKLLAQYPQLPFELESSNDSDPTRDSLDDFILEVSSK
ncbi:MAG: hypothetical protein DRQ46_07745 [Gammaproteobacteria bacterium]|nr:MAG: hypothetical protein DRQ46_07745 [Gammaproteobacteria bacterium]